MNREKLIKECLLLSCFLENIETTNKIKIKEIVKTFNSYTTEQLQKYYEVNLVYKELRLDRIMNY